MRWPRAHLERAPARGERGSTVLELVVAAALAILVLGAGLALLRAHAIVARQLQDELTAVASAAWALDVGARDLELAGADPRRTGVVGIRAADATSIQVDADQNGDGSVDTSSAERLTLSWSSASGGRLLRRLGAQSTAIASPVGSGGFSLRYFDPAGLEIGGGSALDDAQRARVRRVRMAIAVRQYGDRPLPEVRLTSDAALRARLPGVAP